MSNQYLLVLPIEATPMGVRYPQGESLPLHCTVMPWFRLGQDYSFEELNHDLHRLTIEHREGEIELISRRLEFFGPNVDVPVHMLEKNNELNLIHTELLVLLAHAGCRLTEFRWIGAGYRPHVSNTKSSIFKPGTRHIAHYLTLIERNHAHEKLVVGVEMFSDEVP